MGKLLSLGITALNAAAPKYGKSDFDNGPVLAIHHVGPYTVVEYAADNSRSWAPDERLMRAIVSEHGQTRFVAFFNGRSTGVSKSLESAIVHAIAYSKHNVNSQIASMFMTVINAHGRGPHDRGSTMDGSGDTSLTTSTVPNPYSSTSQADVAV